MGFVVDFVLLCQVIWVTMRSEFIVEPEPWWIREPVGGSYIGITFVMRTLAVSNGTPHFLISSKNE